MNLAISLLTSLQLQMNRFSQLSRSSISILFFLFAFCLPLKIDFLLYQSSSVIFSGGTHFFNATFVHISELFLLLGIGAILCTNHSSKRIPLLAIGACAGLVTAVLLTLVFAVDPYLHILRSRYILYGILLVWAIGSSKEVRKSILYGLLSIASLEAFIVIMQSISGKSIGLSIFGEPLFSAELLTTSKARLGEMLYARPYGTMNHPNIVAAFLFITLLVTSLQRSLLSRIPKNYLLGLVTLLVIAIFLTASKSIILLTLGLGGVIATVSSKKRMFTVTLILSVGVLIVLANILDFSTITERLALLWNSAFMLIQYPLGVGLGSFTTILPTISSLSLAPWEIQPVHSLFFLIGNELGLLGLLSMIVLMSSLWKSNGNRMALYATLCIILMGIVDHYFLTDNALSLLLWILIGVLFIGNEKHNSKIA